MGMVLYTLEIRRSFCRLLVLCGFCAVALAFPIERCERDLSNLSEARVSLAGSIQRFLAKHSDTQNPFSKPVDVAPDSFADYLDIVGDRSIEILNAPSANGNRGHLAIRIGTHLYSLNNQGAIERLDPAILFQQETNHLFGQGHRYYGYVLEVSDKEFGTLKQDFESQAGKPQSYSTTRQNCSLNVCKGTNRAGITSIPKPFSLEPSLARIFAESSRRLKMRTRYNNRNGPSHWQVISGQIKHRWRYYRRVFFGIR